MNKKELIEKLRKQKFPEIILKAFEKVEREKFIPEEYRDDVYEDIALPIGHGQTISQPYTIAFMLNLLELHDNQKILEVGSGSGYVLALISEISKNSELFGIERIKELAEKSKEALPEINIIYGNGYKGLKKEAPFDRILVSASADKIPPELVKQLKIGGILVCLVYDSIIKLQKLENKNKIEEYPGFIFVPLIE